MLCYIILQRSWHNNDQKNSTFYITFIVFYTSFHFVLSFGINCYQLFHHNVTLLHCAGSHLQSMTALCDWHTVPKYQWFTVNTFCIWFHTELKHVMVIAVYCKTSINNVMTGFDNYLKNQIHNKMHHFKYLEGLWVWTLHFVKQ